jgi:hypothetical protein
MSPTSDCELIGSSRCCDESPFEVRLAEGVWERVNYTLVGERVELQLPVAAASPIAVRYAWEAWPQCSVYNGKGGFDDHTGIAGTPWCWDGTAVCPY